MQAVYRKELRVEQDSNSSEIEGQFDLDLLEVTKPAFGMKSQDSNENQLLAFKEINRALLRFKLSKNEIKIYIFLARNGDQKAQKIADSLGFQRTEAYKILKGLESKGVIYKVLGRPMKFAAVPFQKMLDTEIESRRQTVFSLEKKRGDLLRCWDSLPKTSEEESEKETIQVLEGGKYISTRICEMLKSSTLFHMVVSDRFLIRLYNSSFFEDLDNISKKRVDVKVLTEYSDASSFVLEQVDLTGCDLGYVLLKNQPSFVVCDSGCMIFIESEESGFTAIESSYSAINKSYSNLFNLIWDTQPK